MSCRSFDKATKDETIMEGSATDENAIEGFECPPTGDAGVGEATLPLRATVDMEECSPAKLAAFEPTASENELGVLKRVPLTCGLEAGEPSALESVPRASTNMAADVVEVGDPRIDEASILSQEPPDEEESESDVVVRAWLDCNPLVIAEKRESLNAELLEMAAEGLAEDVKRLLREGADPCTRSEENGLMPLHLAARGGHVEAVRALAADGAPLEVRTKKLWTPLHNASFAGKEECVRILLEFGADVDARTRDDWTPLHHASWHGNEACVLALLQAGADVEAKNVHGATPLRLARSRNNDTVVDILSALSVANNPRKNSPLELFNSNWTLVLLPAVLNLTPYILSAFFVTNRHVG